MDRFDKNDTLATLTEDRINHILEVVGNGIFSILEVRG